MPDPRIRRPKHGASHGRRPGTGAPERLAAAEAASAEAEAEAEAAASVAESAVADADADAAGPDAAADMTADAAAEAVAAAADTTPDAAANPEAAAADDGAGWFREAPLDEGAPAPGDLPEPEPDVEPESRPEFETVVRERDRPVVTSLPVPVSAVAPRRGHRLRGLLLGVATIVVVAAVGFVAGLLLPTFVPGPGIAVGSPSPGASASPSPTLSAPPTEEPSSPATAVPTPATTPTPAVTPAPTATIYVVKAGDQLARIAAKYGVTVAAIQEANNIKDPNLIRVGQKLVIPPPTPAP